MSAQYTLSEGCEAFEVSRSGYYAWAGRAPCARARADAQLVSLIQAAHAAGRCEYGSPGGLRHWLRERGQRCGRARIGRLMRQMGLAQGGGGVFVR